MSHFKTGVQYANFLINSQLNHFMQCNSKNYQHIFKPTRAPAYINYMIVVFISILCIEKEVLT
jgi:hypothetical protein